MVYHGQPRILTEIASANLGLYSCSSANVVAFEVGRGTAVTMGSQIAFRTQTRATFKLLFNAIFHGPAEPVTADRLATLR